MAPSLSRARITDQEAGVRGVPAPPTLVHHRGCSRGSRDARSRPGGGGGDDAAASSLAAERRVGLPGGSEGEDSLHVSRLSRSRRERVLPHRGGGAGRATPSVLRVPAVSGDARRDHQRRALRGSRHGGPARSRGRGGARACRHGRRDRAVVGGSLPATGRSSSRLAAVGVGLGATGAVLLTTPSASGHRRVGRAIRSLIVGVSGEATPRSLRCS